MWIATDLDINKQLVELLDLGDYELWYIAIRISGDKLTKPNSIQPLMIMPYVHDSP